jgi:hypothetical protein
MNEFRHVPTPHVPGDPLERIVEAFVGQSAPEGPDAAIQLRLIAAMRAADAAAERSLDDSRGVENPRGTRSALRPRRWLAEGVRQFLAIAAAIAVVVAGALALRAPDQPVAPQFAEKSSGNPVEEAIDPSVAPPTVAQTVADRQLADELARIAEEYLRTHQGRLSDPKAVEELLAAVVEKNPEFAKSRTWQFAHDRLTAALDQPRVITLGVGILGTLPWTTYGRF